MADSTERLTETLAEVRVSAATKERLMLIVETSMSRRVSDHIRRAIEMYCDMHERAEDTTGIFAPTNNKQKYVN